jgi:hypothetical protein
MRIPNIRGVIDRRILVNYRVDPDVLAKLLPEPFRPKLIHGRGMAGICLIRLKQVRPRFLPRFFGVSSENAAHRIAVEWDQEGELRQGVFLTVTDFGGRIRGDGIQENGHVSPSLSQGGETWPKERPSSGRERVVPFVSRLRKSST